MQKQKPYWNLKTNSSKPGEVDVFIYGMIGSSGWFEAKEDDTTAFSFVPAFKDLENKYDRINIRINSPGGSIGEGLPVFNAIRQSKKDVHTFNDGIAYSMGAIILMAGKTVHVAKNSLTLLHSPQTYAAGNAKDMRETADSLDTYGESLMTSVADKTGLSIDQVKKKYFDYQDHLMTAQTALDEKLVDVIEDEEGKVPENVMNLSYHEVMNLYQPDPNNAGFLNSIINQMKSVFNISVKKTETKDIIMENLSKFQNALNLDAKSTVDDVLTAINSLASAKKTAEDNLAAAIADKKAIQTSLTAAESSLAAAQSALEALKASDAAGETGASKDKDKIGSKEDPSANYAHNKIADRI